jgi:hypothetical protein
VAMEVTSENRRRGTTSAILGPGSKISSWDRVSMYGELQPCEVRKLSRWMRIKTLTRNQTSSDGCRLDWDRPEMDHRRRNRPLFSIPTLSSYEKSYFESPPSSSSSPFSLPYIDTYSDTGVAIMGWFWADTTTASAQITPPHPMPSSSRATPPVRPAITPRSLRFR